VVAAFLLLPPHPAATRETRTMKAPASAVSFERDTAELLSVIRGGSIEAFRATSNP
jgi:hypothetical protein